MRFARCLLSTGSAVSSNVASIYRLTVWEPRPASVCFRQLISQQESLLAPPIPLPSHSLRGQERDIFIDLINTIGNLRSQSWNKRVM